MDGVRIAAGWVRELQGRWLGSIGVDWRSADGLQSPQRAIGALCGSCDARDGERIRSRELSRTGVALSFQNTGWGGTVAFCGAVVVFALTWVGSMWRARFTGMLDSEYVDKGILNQTRSRRR